MKIIGYGFVPGGDARRHIGKAFTDKAYAQIVVMRPEYRMDHSPGWEWLLRFLHRNLGWNADGLVSFSVIGLLLCIFFCALPWVKYPEAWAAALLAEMVAIPELMTRFVQSRPYLITEGILISLLFAWSKPSSDKPGWRKLALTTIAFAFSCWMHGAWYLWVLPIGAFILACEWAAAGWLMVCWAAGTLAGALLTGSPVIFLRQAVLIGGWISAEHVPSWMLIGEFSPSYGEFATLALMAIVFLWRRQENSNRTRLYCGPVLWLAAIGWILGFKADRFWADWGLPAALVWLAMQFEEIWATSFGLASLNRLIAAGMIVLPLYLTSTNDLDQRYTRNLRENFLDAADPTLKDWLPAPGCIFYSARMDFFYNTFFKNPTADWRYILGFEPALMPPEDLKTLRTIQWNNDDLGAYAPWVRKLKAGDRLAIYSPIQPRIDLLEWTNSGNIWIGRLKP